MKKNKYPILGILVLALIIRLLGINSRQIWYDESLSLLYAQLDFSEMLDSILGDGSTAANVHPPTYFLLLRAWQSLFGSDILQARLLSITAGLLTVLCAYWLMKELFEERTALLASFLIAINPFQIHYSQEIRMYAFMALFLTLATLFFFKALKTSQLRWWFLFSVSAALAQYFQSLSAFYLIGLSLIALFTKNKTSILSAFGAGIGAIVLYIPWLIKLPAQFSKVQSSYWTEKPGIERVFTLLLSYVTNLPVSDAALPYALFSTTLITSIAIWQTIKSLRNRTSETNKGLWLGALAFLPAFIMLIFSQWTPIFIERALLPSGIMFLMWLAWTFNKTNMPKRIYAIQIFLILITSSIGLYQHVFYAGFPYAPYREISREFTNGKFSDGIIVHSNKLSMFPLAYLTPALEQEFIIENSTDDSMAPATQRALGVNAFPSVDAASRNNDTIWFVIFKKSIDEYINAGHSNHPHLIWLNENYRQIGIYPFEDLLIYEFRK